MGTKQDTIERLQFRRELYQKTKDAYIALLDGGVKSYTIGSRSLTKFDLPELEKQLKNLENEIDGLTAKLAGGNLRKTIVVVRRDA